MRNDLAVLLWKEFRQLPRKRGAVLSATIFPILFLVVLPALNLAAAMSTPDGSGMPVGVNLPPGIAAATDAKGFAMSLTLPLFVMISGLMLPSMLAVYTIIAERDRRTLELLVALPVSVSSIVLAKLLAVVAISAGITVPLLVLDSVVLTALGMITLGEILTLFWLLLTALIYSTAASLVVGLLAGDYRTANNVTGGMVGPLIIVAMALLVMLPPGTGALVLSAALLGLSVVAVYFATRRLTFERLIG